MSQQVFDGYGVSGPKRTFAGGQNAARPSTVGESSGAVPNKPKVNPVKIYEMADAVKIGDFGHLFARVQFWRGRPCVMIRRYTPDIQRPSFYHPDANCLFLSQRQFQSLVENTDRINTLLTQYGGSSAGPDSRDDNANADAATQPSEVPSTQAAPPAKYSRPTFYRQNAVVEGVEDQPDNASSWLAYGPQRDYNGN
jgi:hypothetical protein